MTRYTNHIATRLYKETLFADFISSRYGRKLFRDVTTMEGAQEISHSTAQRIISDVLKKDIADKAERSFESTTDSKKRDFFDALINAGLDSIDFDPLIDSEMAAVNGKINRLSEEGAADAERDMEQEARKALEAAKAQEMENRA